MDCSIEDCNRKYYAKWKDIKYCNLHYARANLDIPLNRVYGITGVNNPRWNGGTSEYPNHYLMKKVRKEVLVEANSLCFFCGGKANEIHHKDLSKDNHSKDNLVACCHKCNQLPKHKNSKYKRIYGFTLKELLKIMGINYVTLRRILSQVPGNNQV